MIKTSKTIKVSPPFSSLEQLDIDIDKDWAGKRIENLGAPTADTHAPRARAGDILSGRFGVSRLEWGADKLLKGAGDGVTPTEENFRELLVQHAAYMGDWRTKDKWTDYVSGSGSVIWDSIAQLRLRTGTTSGSHAAVYIGTIAGLSPTHTSCPIFLFVQNDGLAVANSEFRLYIMHSGEATPPADTSKHVGWKIINGLLYATNADGTTETATSTGITLETWTVLKLFIIPTIDNAEVKFYVNGELKATHTTNLPPLWNYFIWLGIKNTAAEDKGLRLKTVNFTAI